MVITQAQVGQFEAGFAQTLAQIDANIVAQVFSETLPIIGNNLQTTASSGTLQLHYVNQLESAITSGLKVLNGLDTYTTAQVESALDTALAIAGFGNLGVKADLSNANDIRLSFTTQRSGDTVSVAIENDLGLPNLGLHTAGVAQTSLNHVFNFTAGLDANGYYVATDPGSTSLSIHSDTRLPGFSASAEMGAIPFLAVDNPLNHSDFTGDFKLTLKDPGGDGRLRVNELGGDLIDATLTGAANVRINLDSALPAAAAMPQIGTDLSLDWAFSNAVVDPTDNNSQFGAIPVIQFNNSSLNLGSFFKGFADKALGEISNVTAPLKPVIDILTTPIPILSDLGSSKVTLLDFAGIEPSQTAAIQGLADILNLGSAVGTYVNDGNVQIDLGSRSVLGDLRSDLSSDVFLHVERDPSKVALQNSDAGKFLYAVNQIGGGGLSFPVLTDFNTIGALLLGQNVDLFNYKTGFGFDKEFAQYFPVLGFVGINLGGHFGMAVQFDFGYDTQGVKDYVAGGSTDPNKVFNGFYAQATDADGKSVTGFQIQAGVKAGIELNIVIASAGVDGDLTATVDFGLSGTLDPAGTGKVRGATLVGTPVGSLFDPAGELTTGLRAYLEVGIDPFSVEFSFDSPRVVLVNFDGDNSNHPIIASDLGNGDLALNVGPRSMDRLIGSLLDSGEAVAIHNLLDSIANNPIALKVDAFGFSETHDYPSHIVGDGGDHADQLVLDADVNIAAVFSGGANRDILTGGAASDYLSGDDGPDVLSGNGGNDTLLGGAGSDRLIGGAGSDLLDGGDGQDTTSYASATTGMAIDLRTMLFTGDGVGDILVSIERYEGTNFDDVIDGDDGFNGLLSGLDGNDTIHGNGGDDLLDGGKGDDLLYGGTGNDFLIGGPGADLLDGGDGIDAVAYTSSKMPVAVSLRTGLGTGGDAQGDTLISIEILIGSPLPFGDLTSRYSPLTGIPIVTGTGDTLEGSDWADVISGLGGADFIDGGAGNDVLYGDAAGTSGALPSTVGFDQDTLRGGLGNDILFGQEDNDDLDGGLGQDMLDGGGGDDHLHTLDLGSVDTLDGGTGVNRLSADYSDKTIAITWIAGQNNDYSFADGDVERNFQNVGELDTGNLPDVIRLDGPVDDSYNNIIRTNGGDDLVFTGFGDDHIEGGDGNDTLYGGAADTRDGNDFIDGGAGDDYVNGGNTRITFIYDQWGTIIGHQGGVADELHGGAGNDTVSFDQLRKTVVYLGSNTDSGKVFGLGVYVNLATNTTGRAAEGIVISGFENIVGTQWGDELTGDDGANIFYPLHGGGLTSGVSSGPDRIDGAGGDDTLVIDFSVNDAVDALGIVTNGTSIYRNTIGNAAVVDSYIYQNIEHLHITGAGKADTLYPWQSGANSDYLSGLGGDDMLGGAGGADTLLGGDGNDTLSGQGTFAPAYAGSAGGHDVFEGGAGDDLVEDISFSSYPEPVLSADALFQLDGGTGFDTLSVDFSNQTTAIVWSSAAPTNLEFADGAYARNFEQLRYLASGSGNDSIVQSGRVDNIFFLGAGDDTVNSGLGVDSIDGGAGNDLAILDFSVGDTLDMAGVQGGGNPDGGTWFRPLANNFSNRPDNISLRGFEHVQVTGTSKSDNILGTYGDDTLIGGDGNDTLDGWWGGNNYIDGGAGDDVLKGSYGIGGSGANDTIYGGAGNDRITPLLGSDKVYGGTGNDTISATDYPSDGYGVDVFDGGDGDDVVSDISFGSFSSGATKTNAATRMQLDGGSGFDTLSVDFGNQTQAIVFLEGTSNSADFSNGSYFHNFEALGNFIAGSGDDTITLTSRGDNNLAGGDGNDTINPGLGIDYVLGGAGNDLLILDYSLGDSANVSGVLLNGSYMERHDLNTNSVVDSIYAGEFEHYQITGGSKADYLFGGGGDDSLYGGSGDDTLNGGAGDDSMIGGSGNDVYYVDSVRDIVIEHTDEGTDRVYASLIYVLGDNLENLSLLSTSNINGTGNSGNNSITGNSGNNVLSGLDGNDTIDGGAGNDTINGGDGFDTAVFTGNFADYSISYDGATATFTVADHTANRDGTDVISAVENFKFADVTKSGSDFIPDTIAPTIAIFSPVDASSGVAIGSEIVLTFSELIQKGSGTIVIHSGSATGAIVASYDVTASNNLEVSGSKLTINPTADLASGTHYFVLLGEGTIKDLAGNNYAGTDTYDFTTVSATSVHALHGSATFWKTGLPITAVTSTLVSGSVVAGTQPIEFRNIQTAADGSRTIEIWETSLTAGINSVKLELALPAGSTPSWQDATGLPSGWNSSANIDKPGQFILGGIGTTALSAGSVKLGALTLTAPTNPQHFDLSLTTGQLGNDIIAGFGLSSDSMTTGTDGIYQHLDMADGTYFLTSAKASAANDKGAVDLLDAIAILKSIVGLTTLNDYQQIAANFDKVNGVDLNDAIGILKYVVGLPAPTPEWIFVDKGDATYHLADSMTIDMTADTEVNLIGIVKGDVNGSWAA